jgi:alkylhydroperoxidase/carboxymuconolactone decarboxylase family protein YurZ
MIGRRATMSNQGKTALDKVALLRANAPYTLAGYGEFRAVIDTDGAVPARLKALFVAVAATDRRYPDLARQELKRGVALGLSATDALAGIIVLSSLRGEGAAGEFAAIVQECVPPGDAAADAPPVTAQPGEAEANFREYFGTIPPPLAQLMRLSPRAADAYYLMRRGSIDANPLSPKYGELLLLAILAAGYSPMAARHVDGARRAGATDAEIAEATLCAIPAAGIAAWMAVGGLLEPAAEPAA